MNTGPHQPLAALADYLRSEQKTKRLRRDANPDAAAALLLGACYQRAFLTRFYDELPAIPLADFAFGLGTTIASGIVEQTA